MRLFHGRHRFAAKKRVAVSELVGTLIVIAVTLIAGMGAWGWVNGQTGTSASQLGQANANNVNYLRESESIALVNFGSNTGISNALSIYVYNKGAVALNISSLSIMGPACAPTNLDCGNANQTVLIVYSANSTPQWSFAGGSGTPLTCLPGSVSGTAIALRSMGTVTITLPSCNFAFATSSTGTPMLLKYSFQVSVQGQFGSSATTVVTR